jgi:replicative DNA helicase
MDLVEDVDKWVGEELHGKRYPTGWAPVDNILGGGITAGEFGMVMAPPGMGKTTMLVNIGYGLAGLIGATNVLHVTLEISVEQLLARYAARVAGVRLSREDDSMNEKQFKAALRKKAGQRLRGKLRAVYGKWTVADIKSTIDNLAAEGFDTGALLIDYPDLMIATRQREEKRFELADICRELRQLGGDYGIPVWGASQSTRETFYKEVIGTASIAEAIEKAAVVDVLVTLNQTREEEQLDQGRLFLAKVRRSKSHNFVPVKINFEHQAIVARMGSNAKTG